MMGGNWLFPPRHCQDRAEDTRKAAATVASGDEQAEASSASKNDDDAVVRPVASGSDPLRTCPKAGARNEARSAQLFIAGVQCSRVANISTFYITPFVA